MPLWYRVACTGDSTVPLSPAAQLAGLALSDAGLEVVIRVSVTVTRLLSKIQFLLCRDQVVVVVGGHVRVHYPHHAPKGWIVAEDEIGWIMYENLMKKSIFQNNEYLISLTNTFGDIESVVPSFSCSAIFC